MTTPAAPESKPSPRSTFARRILANIIGVSVIIGALGVASVGAQGTQDDPAQIEAGMAIFESNCYVRLGFATAQAQDDDAEGEPELAVTGRTTSSLLLVAFSALLGGVALAAASRKIA